MWSQYGYLKRCKFNGKYCNTSSLEYFFHPYYLNCYRFNKNGSNTVSIAGESGEFKIELYSGLPDALNSTYYRGFNVFIQNSSEYPFNRSPSPVQVTPGFGTNFIVSRYFRTQYMKPYSDCTVLENNNMLSETLVDRTLFDQVLATGYEYTQNTCILFCLQRLYSTRCGCISQSISYKVAGYDYCLTSEQTTCLDEFYTNNFTAGTFIADNCLAKCPLECTSGELQTTLAFFKYPYTTLYVDTVLQNNENLNAYDSDHWDFYSDLGNNVVKFSVYYDSLRYTRLEEEPKMSGEDLLGVLGGHLHLFLGMSLLSFVEIVELVCLIVKLTCDPTRGPNRIEVAEKTLTQMSDKMELNSLRSRRY